MLNRLRAALVPCLVALLALAACSAGVSTDQLQGVVLDQPQPKPVFVLTDTNGEPYDFNQRTEGKLALLYFGYTHCPDICPVHMAQIAEVLDQYPDVAEQTVVAFVTVDPERDTPEVIRSFLDNFDPHFVGLTGTEGQIEAAEAAAGVPPAQKVGEGDDYTMNHAGWVLAYAPDGLNHSIYPFGTRQSEWANDLQILVQMHGPESEGM